MRSCCSSQAPSIRILLAALACYMQSSVSAEEQEMVCELSGGTCQAAADDNNELLCGLYMAESSIPGAGWGMYTSKDISHNNSAMLAEYMDVVIQYPDHSRQAELQKELYNLEFPGILLSEYFWTASNTRSSFDADHIESISPGFGMLANCHLGLVNLEQAGCRSRGSTPRSDPRAGASSSYQDCHFTSTAPIPAGHELFDDYGDVWFKTRPGVFGDDLPLSGDYEKANEIVQLWQHQVDGRDNPELASDLWTTVTNGFGPHLTRRSRRALPKSGDGASKIDFTEGGKPGSTTVAYQDFPDIIRSPAWLREHGMCLDHIAVKPLTTQQSNAERGAFARRNLKAGDLVAPAPLVHLSRKHTDVLYADTTNGEPKTVLWQGHQLLLNYCYGHEDSSVLLFPYAPFVNLINHANSKTDQQANVAVRWSDKMTKKEWLDLSAADLLEQNDHAGLMMEFYALTDIGEGEEILLDYGDAWQEAWDQHSETWNLDKLDEGTALVHSDDYISAFEYEKQCDQDIAQDGIYDCMSAVPTWIDSRCWMAPADELEEHAEGKSKTWARPVDHPDGHYYGLIDETIGCKVIEVEQQENGETFYRVSVDQNNEADVDDGVDNGVSIRSVPRSAITFVDRPYTSNQYLRKAFRHEIRLPDAMFPAAWKDLKPEPDSSCGLYMAESAIPHSGLGMYSAKAIPKGEPIFYGDVVIQVEDMNLNAKLRHWQAGDFNSDEPDWLLFMYYWNADVTMGIHDADDVQSIIPGLGMLANSHTGLVNADVKAPTRTTGLHRGRDPGAGASTTYHDVHFDAYVDIEAGAELFVMYGDEWFADRENLGEIPLSDDFGLADESVELLRKIFENDKTSDEIVLDALRLLANITSSRPRLANAIPKDTTGFRKALKDGTASLTVPDRVRSIPWLEKNGRCIDNIRPDKSTIRQAGKGAITTRRLRKGSVIAPMPLLTVRRHHLEIFDAENYDDENTDIWRDGTQLLLNYCFGHPESSLLLFPYSPVINYVNHNSTANAELRWSSLPNHHKQWLKRTPDDLDSEDHSGLIMEMVATREIQAGEEIFVNYGSDWETAWNEFVEEFSPDEIFQQHASSESLNERLLWLRTSEERKTENYPFSNTEGLMVICFIGNFDREVENRPETFPSFMWEGSEGLFDNSDLSYPCEVLERDDGSDGLEHAFDRHDSVKPVDVTYTVMVRQPRGKRAKVKGVPRKAIKFFDAKYMSDNFFRTAFRHEMHLPDAMVPAAWRDLK